MIPRVATITALGATFHFCPTTSYTFFSQFSQELILTTLSSTRTNQSLVTLATSTPFPKMKALVATSPNVSTKCSSSAPSVASLSSFATP